MKVYVVCHGQFPLGMAPNKRRLCLAKALLQVGVDCRVLVFARHDNRPQQGKKHADCGVYEGVPFTFIGKDIHDGQDIASKVRSFCSLFKLASFLMRNLLPGDIVYSYVHDKYTISYMNLIIKLVHFKKAKYVRELCELPFGKGDETKKDIAHRKRLFERQFGKYDGILSISQSLTDLAKQYTRTDCKIFQLPILVEYDQYALESHPELAEVPYIFHSGTLTEQKDGILGMIEAFGMATKQLGFPIRFISTGKKEKSKYKKEIDALVEKYDLADKLLFTGFISDDLLKKYLQEASVVIINKYPTQQNLYCFSTKLGEYMAAGKPLIITNVGEAMNWLTNRKDALIVEPQNSEAMAQAIVELFNNHELRSLIGRNAQSTCQKSFDYEVYGQPLKDYFSKL